MISAKNIDEVITQLDNIIERCITTKSRMGYFACLYRKMTMAVKQGILIGSFENGQRMELLDVIFANRYLQAYEAYTNKKPCTNAWCKAFDATTNNNLIVLQHLLLGINTHINLDLGIAAAQACPGSEIYDLQADFNKINDVISSLMQSVQTDLSEVWPPLKLLTGITNNQQDAILNFSITAARKASWANALALAIIPEQNRQSYIDTMDKTVVKLSNRILNPGFIMSLLLKPVEAMEDSNVSNIISRLHD